MTSVPAPSDHRRLGWLLGALVLLIQLPVIFSHENYLLTWFNIDDGF